MRTAARAVVATVGAVLAGLVLALPAVLPLSAPPAAPSAVLTLVAHHPVALPGHAGHEVRSPLPAAAAPVAVRAPATAWAVLGADAVAPWVLLAAALVGLSRPARRARRPSRAPHRGPAPLRGPPAAPAPAP